MKNRIKANQFKTSNYKKNNQNNPLFIKNFLKADHQWSKLYFMAPLIAITFFALLIGPIIYALIVQEEATNQDNIYHDIQSAKQKIDLSFLNLKSQILVWSSKFSNEESKNEKSLAEITHSMTEFMATHPEVSAISMLNPHNKIIWQYNRGEDYSHLFNNINSYSNQKNVTKWGINVKLIKLEADGDLGFYFSAPIIRNNQFAGMIHVVVPCKRLISMLMNTDGPQNKYIISIKNPKESLKKQSFYISVGPIGQQILLEMKPRTQTARIINTVLFWLVIGLSLLIVLGLFILWQYIKVRIKMENQLLTEVQFRESLVESMNAGIIATDQSGKINYVNRTTAEMMRSIPEALVGLELPYPFVVRKKDLEPFADFAKKYESLQHKNPVASVGIDVILRRFDATTFHGRIMIAPLVGPNGKKHGWIGSITDTTAIHQAREELENMNQQVNLVLESVDASVSVLSSSGDLLFANQYYKNLFGDSANGHRRLSETISPQTNTLHPTAIQYENETEPEKVKEIHLSDINQWFEVRQRRIKWLDETHAMMIIATDISPRKEAEEFKRITEERTQFNSRLITMGEMASMVAHELNQPLSAINNYITGCINRLNNNSIQQEDLLVVLNKISEQALRAGKVISRIRGFVQRSDSQLEFVDVANMLNDLIELLRLDANRRNIQIDVSIGELSPVFVDKILFEQVIVNLVKNAMDAIWGQQAAEKSKLKLGKIKIIAINQLNNLIIQVDDNGGGAEPATLARLFEPFFSTKKDGMGMGLSICRSIVESFHGQLEAENIFDNNNNRIGCRFRLTIPLQQPQLPLNN